MTTPLSIAVFGATGHVGAAITAEAAARGHRVTTVSRRPSAAVDARVAVRTADVRDPDAVAGVIAGHDAVVAAVAGRGPDGVGTVPQAARSLLLALPQAGVSRLVFVGGGGSLVDSGGQRFVDNPYFPEQYKAEALAASEALDIFRGSSSAVLWSYISPPPIYLLDGIKTGVYRTQADDRPVVGEDGESRITLGDLASAVIDAAENGMFPRQRFTVGY